MPKYWPLTANDVTVEVGATVNADVTATPEDVALSYAVADETIATVDAEGIITGVKEGQTDVTVTATKGEESATDTFKVTVSGVVQPLTIECSAVTAVVGSSVQFTAKQGETAINDVTWSVSDETKGLISSSGRFVALEAGAVTVTATKNSQTASFELAIAGVASGVKFTAASSTLIANNESTDEIIANVVDTAGNIVSNFNGTANIARTPANGTLVDALGTAINSITFTNGVATFYLSAPAAVPTPATVSITASALVSTNAQPVAANVSYTPLVITYVAPTAAGLAITPASSTISANASANSVNLSVAVTDSGNVDLANVASPAYINLAISGPGSFTQVTASSPTATTTTTIVISGGANPNTTLNVFPIEGQTGTITISATSTGLTSAEATINSVVTGQAASFELTSQTGTLNATQAGQVGNGLTAGTSYTIYTVTFKDANGNSVNAPAGDALTITTNNAGLATPGVLYFYNYNATTQTFTAQASQANIAVGGTSVFRFGVLNGTAGSAAITVTVADTVLALNKTATYNFVSGGATQVALKTAQSGSISVKAGETATVDFQLQDASGNDIAVAGTIVRVWFRQAAAPTGVTLGSNLASPFANSVTPPADAYQATTDANGVASVNVVASATASGTFTINAAIQNQAVPQAITGNVVALANAINSLILMTTTNDVTTRITVPAANTLVSGIAITNGTLGITGPTAGNAPFVAGLNAINALAAGAPDQLTLTTSNRNVLSLGLAGPNGAWTVLANRTTATATATVTGVQLPTITAGQAGTATITITNLAVPSKPSVQFNVTVVPATAAGTGIVKFNGLPIRASNPLVVAANTPVQVTIDNVDAGGNVVPVTTAEGNGALATRYFTLADPNGGAFRTTVNGQNTNILGIPVGQTTATMYYVNATAGSYTTTPTATANPMAVALAGSAAPVAGTASNYTITLTNTNYSGVLPITIAGTVPAPNAATATVPTMATFVNGVATVSITFTAASLQPLTATVNGTLSAPFAVTPVAGAVNNLVVTTAAVTGARSTTDPVDLATQPVITLRDQYNNVCATGTSATANVTISVTSSTPAGATLGGTTTVAAVAGVATFVDINVTPGSDADITDLDLQYASGAVTVTQDDLTMS